MLSSGRADFGMEPGVQEIYYRVFLKLATMVEAKEAGLGGEKSWAVLLSPNASADSTGNAVSGIPFRVVTNWGEGAGLLYLCIGCGHPLKW